MLIAIQTIIAISVLLNIYHNNINDNKRINNGKRVYINSSTFLFLYFLYVL